jgi:integrase
MPTEIVALTEPGTCVSSLRISREDLACSSVATGRADRAALRRGDKSAREKPSCEGCVSTDLRHTFGSAAIKQATLVRPQSWMEHADVQTTMKYMHHRSGAGDTRLLSVACLPKKTNRCRRKASVA